MDRRPFPYETRLKIAGHRPLRRHPVHPFVPRWKRFYESTCDRNYFYPPPAPPRASCSCSSPPPCSLMSGACHRVAHLFPPAILPFTAAIYGYRGCHHVPVSTRPTAMVCPHAPLSAPISKCMSDTQALTARSSRSCTQST